MRLLKKEGAAVRVVLSRGATEFITPLTMQALSGEPTHTELLDEEAEAGMGHIELAAGRLMIIAPPPRSDRASAQGRADDLLTTAALATPAPVAVAPAMNQQMWATLPLRTTSSSSSRVYRSSVRMQESRLVAILGRATA